MDRKHWNIFIVDHHYRGYKTNFLFASSHRQRENPEKLSRKIQEFRAIPFSPILSAVRPGGGGGGGKEG